MNSIVLIGSIIGIVNSFILIIYALTTEKGNKITNQIFAFLIFMLSIRISKSILVSFSYDLHEFIITLGLVGFLAIGPAFYFLTRSVIERNFTLKWKHSVHLIPAILLLFLWFLIDDVRASWNGWHLFYRLILLQFMIYLTHSVFRINFSSFNRQDLIFQLNIISYFLAAIWFLYLLNDVSGFPYISGAILYSFIIYFSLFIVINKGQIINHRSPKYKKTGLKKEEENRIISDLNRLLENDKIYTSNTLSLGILAKKLDTNTHALSQAINKNYQKSFFELLAEKRIEEAKILLKSNKKMKISEIAYEVGYNSLSAFNNAFKKHTGITPSNYRNAK